MHRPSRYEPHNITLDKFCELFNSEKTFPNITIYAYSEETYDNDGVITDSITGKTIGFDWEYRDNPNHFSNCNLRYPTLGQFERKLQKDSIQISIQCDQTQTGIAVGWHEDWLKEKLVQLKLRTDKEDEDGFVRYTSAFKIYPYNQMEEFKRMLSYALQNDCLNHKSF